MRKKDQKSVAFDREGTAGTTLKMPKIGEVRSSSQTARATLALREMLVNGRLRPGERIREVPLAAQLSVSRIPLRLALERLAHEGFLQIRPTRGFVVQQFSTEDIYDAIELRGLLEGAAARLAAERLKSPADLATMRETSRQILNLVRRPKLKIAAFKQYIGLNEKFHPEQSSGTGLVHLVALH
ncbi:MAG TPA: GntR family transcriptional regulator [Terriglobia bacterium]|nr:GntR family transcriptional regulator [Terriglobia bacterium]